MIQDNKSSYNTSNNILKGIKISVIQIIDCSDKITPQYTDVPHLPIQSAVIEIIYYIYIIMTNSIK